MLVFVRIIILTIPRSGLALFGGAGPELSRADGAQVEHAARGGASQNVSAVGGWGRVEAALSPPRTHLCVGISRVHKVSVSFCLD